MPVSCDFTVMYHKHHCFITQLDALFGPFCSERPHQALRSQSCIMQPSHHIDNSSPVTDSDNVASSSVYSRKGRTYSACSLQEADKNTRTPDCMHSSPLPRMSTSCPGMKVAKASHRTDIRAIGNASSGHGQPQSLQLMELESHQFRLDECQSLLLQCKQELIAIERPKPKWYEMKTPEFHLEAHRQNNILHNATKWQRVLEGADRLLCNEV